LANNSDPFASNVGQAQMSDPAPRTRTAYVVSLASAEGGVTDPVQFEADTAQYHRP